jgi:hypothetical protein
MRIFPSEFRAEHADAIDAIARECFRDMHRRRGLAGLLCAWRRLAVDLLVGAFAEWQAYIAFRLRRTQPRAVLMVLAACVLDGVCNFVFGNDLASTLAWASAIFGIAFMLGLSLRSLSLGLIVLLVISDTTAGSLSVYTTHHSFSDLFADTLRWVPVAFAVFAGGSFAGGSVRNLAARISL